MARKVAAELTLDAKQYIAEAKLVEQRTAAVDHEMDQLDRSIDKVDRDAAELAASTLVAAKAVDSLGDQAGGTARALTLLDARIKATRLSMHALGVEAALTGDVDVNKRFNAERAALARLERLRKTLTPSPVTAEKLFDPRNFGGFDFSGFAAESRGFLIAGAVGLGIAASPILAGIISSAVLGAVGTGGVVGGAVLATRDFRVQKAFADLGTSLMHELDPAGQAFVDPMIRAAGTFKQAFDAAGIVTTLKTASALVDPLVAGLAGFVRELGPGLQAGVIGAGPTMKMLAQELPDLAGSISNMLQSMRGVAPEAAMAFGDLFDTIEAGVTELGDMLAGLTLIYSLTRSLNSSVKELTGGFDLLNFVIETSPLFALGKLAREKVVPTLEAIDPAARAAADAFAVMDTNLVALTPGLDFFAQTMEHVRDSLHGWIDAEVDVEEALDNLAQSFRDNGTTLDVTEEKGRANIRMLEAYERATINAFNAELEHTKSVEDANAVWQHYKDELYKVLAAFGIVGDAADALVVKFLGLAPGVTIPVTVVYTPVLRGAGSQAEAYVADTVGNPFIKGFAAGGETPAFEPFRVHKDETLWSSREMFVATAAQSNALTGGGDVAVTVLLDGQAIEPRMVKVITDRDRNTRRRVQAG